MLFSSFSIQFHSIVNGVNCSTYIAFHCVNKAFLISQRDRVVMTKEQTDNEDRDAMTTKTNLNSNPF